MDADGIVRRATLDADGEDVWSWHPWAGAKFADEPQATVTNKVMDTGESTEKAVNRCAGNAGLFRRPVVTESRVITLISHEAMGAAEHPVFPAPSSL
jgi:hypothetical protein